MVLVRRMCTLAGMGLAIAVGGLSSPVSAQEATEPCEEYLACALRIEPGGFFSGSSIVRGVDGERVAGYGRSSGLAALFQVSDSASVWYARFEPSDRTASWLGGAGAALLLASVFVPLITDRSDDDEAIYVGLSLAGVGLGLASTFPARNARRSMSQAIWWYNADLAR